MPATSRSTSTLTGSVTIKLRLADGCRRVCVGVGVLFEVLLTVLSLPADARLCYIDEEGDDCLIDSTATWSCAAEAHRDEQQVLLLGVLDVDQGHEDTPPPSYRTALDDPPIWTGESKNTEKLEQGSTENRQTQTTAPVDTSNSVAPLDAGAQATTTDKSPPDAATNNVPSVTDEEATTDKSPPDATTINSAPSVTDEEATTDKPPPDATTINSAPSVTDEKATTDTSPPDITTADNTPSVGDKKATTATPHTRPQANLQTCKASMPEDRAAQFPRLPEGIEKAASTNRPGEFKYRVKGAEKWYKTLENAQNRLNIHRNKDVAPAVPDGWKAKWSTRHERWYYTSPVRQSQWDLPTEADPEPSTPPAPSRSARRSLPKTSEKLQKPRELASQSVARLPPKKQPVVSKWGDPSVGTHRSSGCANGRKLFRGPRGGLYHENRNGNKTYV